MQEEQPEEAVPGEEEATQAQVGDQPPAEEQVGEETAAGASDAEGVAGPEIDAQSDGAGQGDLGLINTNEASALQDLIGVEEVTTQASELLVWAQNNLLTLNMALQLGVLLGGLIPAAIFGPQIKKLIATQLAPRAPYGLLRRAANAFTHIATPIALYVIWQIAIIVIGAAGRPTAVVEAGVSLLTAWIIIRLVTLVIRSPFWSKVAFYVAWPIAALDAFGVLDDVTRQLDGLAIPLGENDNGNLITFSALDLIRTLVIFGVLFWLAGFVNRFLTTRIQGVDELTPSLQALLIKILNILTPVIAFLIALQVVGFNLATLTIFGGAVGLGIGLGLQRTISNFFAGFTLIADKSIKPGDVIEVGDTFGWVTQMNSRYVSVRTRDGTAHLVPNDKFIEDGVINWSHSDKVVRLHAPFGVAYSTRDVRAIARAAEEMALSVERVVEKPAPRCNLVEFGDSSVNFDLRFWITDPANGIANVRSDVMMAVWDKLHDMGIEIPFPQRDLHIKSWTPQPAIRAADEAGTGLRDDRGANGGLTSSKTLPSQSSD
ncbi:MAG: mechanosensitive ion channel domain-containing protein [Pseudomonadota bacterium]